MENQNEWILESLNIYRPYGNGQDYSGNVKFRNGRQMEFSLLLDADKCAKMVAILKDEIVSSACQLGDMMVKSMPVQIQETNP